MIHKLLAFISLISAIIISTYSLTLPPEGDVTVNMLLLTAQLITYSATVLGIKVNITKYGKQNDNNNGSH